MAQSAYVKFVSGSAVAALTLEEVKERLLHYRDQLGQTARQLGWEYDEAGFPYTIETKPEGEGKWFYLKGTNALYRNIVIGVGSDGSPDEERAYVQFVLPDNATHGDKSKGNEYCKYLGKLLKAELHLFNGRVMYFNPRK